MMDNMQPDEIIYNSCPPSPPATSSPPPPTPMYPPWPPTLPPSPVASAGEQIASWALGFAIALGVTIICTVVPKYLVGPLPEGSGVDKDGKPWTAATLHAEHKLYLMEPVTVTCAELPKLAKKEGIGQSRTIYERVKVYFLLPLAVLLAVIDVIMSVANFELSTGSATGNAWDAVNYYMTAFLLMDVFVMLHTVPRKDDGSLDLTAIRVCPNPTSKKKKTSCATSSELWHLLKRDMGPDGENALLLELVMFLFNLALSVLDIVFFFIGILVPGNVSNVRPERHEDALRRHGFDALIDGTCSYYSLLSNDDACPSTWGCNVYCGPGCGALMAAQAAITAESISAVGDFAANNNPLRSSFIDHANTWLTAFGPILFIWASANALKEMNLAATTTAVASVVVQPVAAATETIVAASAYTVTAAATAAGAVATTAAATTATVVQVMEGGEKRV